MSDQKTLISAFSREWDISEESVTALVERRHASMARFMAQWNVPHEALRTLLAQTSFASTVHSTDGTETADFSLDDGADGSTSFAPEPALPHTAGNSDITLNMEYGESQPAGMTAHDGARPDAALAHGAMLGRYEDLGLLGTGGMGEVRRVRDRSLRRTMAMKIIHRDWMHEHNQLSRFVEEAQIQAQLQHPNIVPVYEIAQLPDGRHYFTMKQIRGQDLSVSIQAVHQASPDDRWRPSEDGISFRDLIRVHQQVCEAVAYAHSQGVIHRDLKPANIMIGGFGEVLVVDWGLAKVLGRDNTGDDDDTEVFVQTDRSYSDALRTRSGSVAGTPCYMAPEQAFGRNDEVGTATDVYTLGAILYEILTGQPPFTGASAQEVLEKVKHSAPSVLRESAPLISEELTPMEDGEHAFSVQQTAPLPSAAKIPDRLAEICEQAMARDIESRCASAGRLAGQLKAWLEGAEKRDKGLEQVAAAETLAAQARSLERKSRQIWTHANALLREDGADSATGWQLWSEHRTAAAEARRLWERHGRALQGALVHAPELEEAHTALAELRLEELLGAAAVGDSHARQALQRQWSSHLQMLSPSKRANQNERLTAGLRDAISGQRLRRGALIGRHAQREAVCTHVNDGARLLTLLGTAGVGKTRLALELADDLRERFTRTTFCDLTEAKDATDVVLRLSRALDVRLRDTDPVEHLGEILSAAPTLLILDNLEQLTSVMGPLVTDWLSRADHLQILSTSRLRLGVEAETAVPIQPLSLLEGVDLFLQRAQTADRGFELTDDNRPLICELIDRLDGLPLAIELAAARLNIFSVDEIVVRLNERFSLLRSRGRDAQTLDGALDWSWDLLQPWAKAALSQASLFRGGFTLASAEGVIEVGTDKKAPAMFDILGELVENSLLRRDRTDRGEIRYSLLESIRAYASDKLGDAGPPAKHRHADHFSQLGSQTALQALYGFDSKQRWEELFSELDNLVEAIGNGEAQSAARCCLAALKVLGMKGPVSLGVDLASQVLEMEGVDKSEQMMLEIERSKCLRISGRMREARQMVTGSAAVMHGVQTTATAVDEPFAPPEREGAHPARPDSATIDIDPTPAVAQEDGTDTHPDIFEAERLLELGKIEGQQSRYAQAIECFERALDLFREHGARRSEGNTLGKLGNIYGEQSQFERAGEHYRQGITIAQETGDKHAESEILGNLGNIHQLQGRLEQATIHYSRSLAIARDIGDERSAGAMLGKLGGICLKEGRYNEAKHYYRQSIAIAQDIGARRSETINLGNMGNALMAQGEYTDAIAHYQRSVSIAREIGSERSEAINLGNMGNALMAIGSATEAETAFREAIVICDQSTPVAAGAFRASLALLLAQQGRTSEALTLLEVGEAQVRPELLEHAKFLCKKGEVYWMAGDLDESRVALTEAQRISSHLQLNDDSELGTTVAALRSRLKATVDAEEPPADPTSPSLGSDGDRDEALIEARRLLELGTIEREQSRYSEAEDCYAAALKIFQERSDEVGACETHGALGLLHQSLDQYSGAIEHHKQAISIARRIGAKHLEGPQLGNLGNVYWSQGQLDRAVEHYTLAIAIAQEIGNKSSEAAALGNLANVFQAQGHLEQAVDHCHRGIAIAREIGHKNLECNQLGCLGTLYHAQGRFQEAIEHCQQAISMARDIGKRRTEAIYTGNLANGYRALGRLELAVSHYRQAIVISSEFGARRSEGIQLGNLGDALFRLGQLDDAEAAFRAAIQICDEAIPGAAGAFRGALALLLAHQDKLTELESLLETGEPLVESFPSEHAKFLCRKAQIFSIAGDRMRARSTLNRAQELAAALDCSSSSELGRALSEAGAMVGPDVSTVDTPKTTGHTD